MSSSTVASNRALSGSILKRAALESFRKLDPRRMIKNPVMFVVEVGSVFTSLLCIEHAFAGHRDGNFVFVLSISLWLWFTVLFANFAEALAEGRGKAQADALRKTKQHVQANRLQDPASSNWNPSAQTVSVPAQSLVLGDLVLVRAGEMIPNDGEALAGVASVDESAITGESAPVIRESGGDRSAVTGGTRVLSDWLIVRVSAAAGDSFLDRMIAMVEGAKRQKTPNEIALSILLASLTIVFLIATVTLDPFSRFAVQASQQGRVVPMTVLVALLVCLIPTTIGGLLSAIGIAGMDRLVRANVIAKSGRAVEAAGDVDVLLLDKTGTITLGNRQATAFFVAQGVSTQDFLSALRLASLADETPEGRSIVALIDQSLDLQIHSSSEGIETVSFSAETRMSGVNLGGEQIRKGASDAVVNFVTKLGGEMPKEVQENVTTIAQSGGTPLVVCKNERVLGVVQLKDVVKPGMKEKFGELRRAGIRTVMVTGDNPLTAAAIAAEAGVDEFLAQATPETKLSIIRKYQADGHLVAMTGDGTNDAPALAQADVAVAMNTGTTAAKEAANMVDLDSDPTKLMAVVQIGKQMLMTRGALTTFSIANDVAKYFAIIPAAFASTYPVLGRLDVMRLHSPNTAVLSAVIFNALIILALIPIALRGVNYQPMSAEKTLRKNVFIYGLGGLVAPFPFIKAIDLLLTAAGMS